MKQALLSIVISSSILLIISCSTEETLSPEIPKSTELVNPESSNTGATGTDSSSNSSSDSSSDANSSETTTGSSTESSSTDSNTTETATDSNTTETATDSSTTETATDSNTTETSTDSSTTESATDSSTTETATDSNTTETATDSSTTESATDSTSDVNNSESNNPNTNTDATQGGTKTWTGPLTNFTKADGASPNTESNQDRLTANVWITRGNGGGQIYNAAANSSADKSTSPVGTEWAIGALDQKDNLTFQSFRDAVNNKPKNNVGVDMVLHLIEDDIYLSVRFTSWSSGQRGGFAYERSTP